MLSLHSFHFAASQEIVQYQGSYEKENEDSAKWMFFPTIKKISEYRISTDERVTDWAFNNLSHMEVDEKIVKINITIHGHSNGIFADRPNDTNSAVVQIFANLALSIADTAKRTLPNLDLRQSQFRLIQTNGPVCNLIRNLDRSLDPNKFYCGIPEHEQKDTCPIM